jgi:hypothetical protein
MSQLHHAAVDRNSSRADRGPRTAGGFVVMSLVLPVVVALMAAPGVVLGAALGVGGIKLGERMVGRLSQAGNEGSTRQSAGRTGTGQLA